MNTFWYWIGHALQYTLEVLVTLGWLPVTLFSLVLAFGLVYWLGVQAKYTRRAKEKGGYI